MNFLIAVVNQSFEAAMRSKSQKFSVKLSLLDKYDHIYDDYFIVKNNRELTRVEEEEDIISDQDEREVEEWQGLVKELKKDIEQNIQVVKKEIMIGERKGQKEIMRRI